MAHTGTSVSLAKMMLMKDHGPHRRIRIRYEYDVDERSRATQAHPYPLWRWCWWRVTATQAHPYPLWIWCWWKITGHTGASVSAMKMMLMKDHGPHRRIRIRYKDDVDERSRATQVYPYLFWKWVDEGSQATQAHLYPLWRYCWWKITGHTGASVSAMKIMLMKDHRPHRRICIRYEDDYGMKNLGPHR